MATNPTYESSVHEPADRYEKLYTMLFDAIPSSVVIIDRDMRIIMANRNFLEMGRRTLAGTIDRRLEEVFPAAILDQMGLASRVHGVLDGNQQILGDRMTYRAPGIPLRIYYYSILPFSWLGVIESAILLMEDVTEKVRLGEEVRRVERHLACVVESATDIVLSTDTNGKILSWNAAAERVSGYRSEEVSGLPLLQFYAAKHHEEIQGVLSSLGSMGGSRMSEWELITKSGEGIPVSWVCSAMVQEGPRPLGIVAVGRDLTERRKLEMQLLQSQKLAALGVMAGGIAHELRNPLAICSSAAQFLMDENVTPEFFRECAHKICKSVRRASDIIENLLHFARSSTQSAGDSLDLSTLVNESVALIANEATIQKIKVVFRPPEAPVRISGIATLLSHLFVNLFLNSINAMPTGGVLSVSIDTTGSEALVRVADTGYGISESDIHKIFDPFYTTCPSGKGVGLGLSLCYSIVKQHFGSIEAGSVEGKGTVMTVRLPTLMNE